MTEELRCPYCNKSCRSGSGLTNHVKTCPKKLIGVETQTADLRDVDPRSNAEFSRSSGSTPSVSKTVTKPVPKSKPSNGPAFDIGAFLILEHLMIMLDLNFAAALAEHILTRGSDNKAILAFGHQLAKVSDD